MAKRKKESYLQNKTLKSLKKWFFEIGERIEYRGFSFIITDKAYRDDSHCEIMYQALPEEDITGDDGNKINCVWFCEEDVFSCDIKIL